ncbi:MAG: transposase, partial [Nanoarchaeota archaeon]
MSEICEKCKSEFEKLQAEVIELRKILNILTSPHIPSSKKIIKEKTPEEPKEPKKLGAPEGHKGATRKTPIPNRIVRHEKPRSCIKCKSQNLKIKQRKKIAEDIIIIPDITEIHYFDCICIDCGKMFETASPELPVYGKFGPNITALWENMHYIGTIPFKRLSTISRECLDTSISPSGLMNVIYRSSKTFESGFEDVKENVRLSDYAGSDETKYSDSWLWNISTRTDVLVLMRNTRSSAVLMEAFGKSYSGILNSDCFSAYEKYEADEYQKCWAHIIRDGKNLAKHNDEGKSLYREISRMYKYIARIKENKEENTNKVKLWIWRQKKIIKSWLEKKY